MKLAFVDYEVDDEKKYSLKLRASGRGFKKGMEKGKGLLNCYDSIKFVLREHMGYCRILVTRKRPRLHQLPRISYPVLPVGMLKRMTGWPSLYGRSTRKYPFRSN